MERNINYSIIIPHKNIFKLLKRCLNSIPRRKDVQIIVIDDNSNFKNLESAEFPGIKDPFVEVVFAKEGKGAGYARNIGLKKALGKWIIFADADDYFNYCIFDILDEYVNSDYDIIYFKNTSLDCDMYTLALRDHELNRYIDKYLALPVQRNENLLKYDNTVPWAKIFKASLIKKHNISFDEVSNFNDVTFNYLAGFYSSKIIADPRALYCVTRRDNSITFSKNTIDRELNKIYIYGKRYKFFEKCSMKNKQKYFLGFLIIRPYVLNLFKNEDFFNNANIVLLESGFKKNEVIRICVYSIFLYIPKRLCREAIRFFKAKFKY